MRAKHTFLLVAVAAARFGVAAVDADGSTGPLRVQLKWIHQAQFAGYYAAQDQGYFEARDLQVELTPGAPGNNPLLALADDTADVAEGSMDQAVAVTHAGTRVVNVAQLFQRPDSVLICRARAGIASPRDLIDATVAVGDRRPLVEAMFEALFGAEHAERYIPPQPFIEALTRQDADCQWGSTFNEYWRAEQAGLEVFTVTPEELGVVNIEDGLYVRADRLGDSSFRRQLVDLLIGLEQGWSFAADQPTSAVQLVLAENPALGAGSQRQQLEAVLPLFGDQFGYFDIGRYETVDRHGIPRLPASLVDRLWTHDVYHDVQHELGRAPFVTPVTEHYIEVLRSSPWYQWMIRFGVVAAALSGALVGARLGYRFWGRLVLAAITALGGGVLRDVLLGGSRYPTYLVDDPSDLYLVLGTAVVVTLLTHARTRHTSLASLDRVAAHADIVGFSVLAVNGATVAIVADAHMMWVPIAAALTVAGGGILTDVLTRREHEGFRGHVYEEAAVLGAVALLAGLAVANRHEHRPSMVLWAVLLSLAVLVALRVSIHGRRLRYPQWGAHRVTEPTPDEAHEAHQPGDTLHPGSGAAHSGEYGLYASSHR